MGRRFAVESKGPRRRLILLYVCIPLAAVLGTSTLVALLVGRRAHDGPPRQHEIVADVEPPEAAERILEGMRVVGKDPIRAIAELRAVARDYPGTLAAAKALSAAAGIYSATGRTKEAEDAYMEAARSCPTESPFLVKCWLNVFSLHRRLGGPSEGLALYKAFVENARATEYADLAHAELVGVLDRAGEYSEALNEYQSFRRRYPKASREARSVALQNVVYAYEGHGEADKALSAAREWVKAAPKGSEHEAWANDKVKSLEKQMAE